MPQVGPMEILVIAAIALIVFGPEKLPDIARQIGRAARELRRMASEVKDEFDGFDIEVEDEKEIRLDDAKSDVGLRPDHRASEEPVGEPPGAGPEADADPAEDPMEEPEPAGDAPDDPSAKED